MEIRVGASTVILKPTSHALLAYLVGRRGRWVRAEELGSNVLGTTFERHASNLRWHVLQTRRALGGLSPALHSDNRLGFMFELEECGRPHCKKEGRLTQD